MFVYYIDESSSMSWMDYIETRMEAYGGEDDRDPLSAVKESPMFNRVQSMCIIPQRQQTGPIEIEI